MMKYKGYIGNITYDSDTKSFFGQVIGIKDVITFRGTSAEELEKEFKKSINCYLKWCEELGDKPEKSFSGKLNLRLDPKLHAQISAVAQLKGVSLNSFIADTLIKSIS